MPDTNEKVAALTREQIESLRVNLKPYSQNAGPATNLIKERIDILCDMALRSLENPKGGQDEDQKATGTPEQSPMTIPVPPAGPEQVRELLDRARKWRDTLRWEGSTDAMYALAKDVVAVLESALPLAPLAAEWVQVPREPTDVMVEAADLFFVNASFKNVSPAQIRRIYAEMLAAAPSAQRGRDE